MAILILLTLTFTFQPKLIVYLYCNEINHLIVLIRCVVLRDVTVIFQHVHVNWKYFMIQLKECLQNWVSVATVPDGYYTLYMMICSLYCSLFATLLILTT